MARRQARQPALTRKYYVFDDNVQRYLGGFPVKQEGNYRVVVLTEEQAQYWMKTGTVGKTPLDTIHGEARRQLHQLSGGRIALHHDEKVRTTQVVTMGIQGGKPGKVKVTTTRNAVQNPATNIDNVIKHGGYVMNDEITTEQRRKARSAQHVVFSSSEGMTPGERSRK
jgi:hypothetical protein